MSRRRKPRHTLAPVCEPLEPRLLLAGNPPVITTISADNRGLVELVVNQALDPSTVNSNSVRVYTAGRDGLLGTGDDALASSVISYDVNAKTIRATASIIAGSRYRVQVFGDQILGNNGEHLDAEFNGSGKNTGNGVAGGTLQFFTKSFALPVVRFTTIAGTIDVDMFADRTPLTVQNFFNYMNSGVYDTTFFHRSVTDPIPFVIQTGGFTANNSFSPIPQNPTVMNEPGISNLRGTLAMAKLGNNPNSATNQFFFNLGDNSQNLDNQNGGFTVFAEVRNAAGLTVMDALAAYDTVSATQINGAFGELPVRDTTVVDARGFPIPADLITITRVAEILDITAEPFKQLPTQGQVVLSSQSGGTQLYIYSLNGVSLGSTNSFITASFSGDKLNSIKITGNIPAPIGIQIISSQSVGSITDSRSSPDSNLAFIISNARIDSINLRGSISGYDINDTLVAGDTLLPEDIDTDGRTDDPTAIVLLGTSLNKLSIAKTLTGSVVADQGVQSTTVRGDTNNADFVYGPASTFISSVFNFARVRGSAIHCQNPISSIVATEFGSTGQRGGGIAALSIGNINITGAGGASGDFQADLSLVGSSAARTLGSVNIKGVVYLSNWSINGDVGNINIGGGTSEFVVSISGDAVALASDRFTNTAINIAGKLSTLRTSEWLGGALSAGSLIQLATTGGRNSSGDLSAEVNIGAGVSSGVRSFRVAGDLRDSTLNFATPVNGFSVGSDVSDSTITGTTFNALSFKRVSNLTFNPTGAVKSVTAWEWLGGSFLASEVRTFTVIGNRRAGINGDLSASVRLRQPSLVRITGDVRDTNLDIFTGNTLIIGGDVSNATVTFNQVNAFFAGIIRATIQGDVSNSQIIANDVFGDLVIGSLHNSTVNVGGSLGNDFFTAGSAYAQTGYARSITIGASGSKETSLVNSSIVGNRIDAIRIYGIDTFNNSISFGISARQLGKIDLVTSSGVNRFSSPTDAFFLDDFEIRPNFVAPVRG